MDARKAFEQALIVDRVAGRFASTQLDDKEAAALVIIIGLKPSHRADSLERMDVKYSPEDPTIKSLIQKGFVKLQGGKSITPDKDKARKALEAVEQPEKYRQALLGINAHFYFKKKSE